MKNFAVVLIMLGLLGCSYGRDRVELMLDNPGLLEDSLYAGYHQRLDELEGRYLRKEISYAEYIELKQDLEDSYSVEAERRKKIIEGN